MARFGDLAADGEVAPEGVEEEQGGDEEEGVREADAGDELAAEEGAGEHAEELRGLVEAVDAAEAGGWRDLPDEVVGRWHKARRRNAVDKAQDGELPDRGHEALRDGDEPGEGQAAEQDFLRAEAVGEIAEFGRKQRRGDACAREHGA